MVEIRRKNITVKHQNITKPFFQTLYELQCPLPSYNKKVCKMLKGSKKKLILEKKVTLFDLQ